MFYLPCKRGFTLVELLIALAVMAMLATLLLPTISASRNAALASRCQANLRQIGSAVHAYIGDHNGRYPPNAENNSGYEAAHLSEYPYGVDHIMVLEREGYLNSRASTAATGNNNALFLDGGPWICPAFKDLLPRYAIYSYGMNYYLGNDGPSSKPWWLRPSASSKSGGLIYLMDTAYNFSPKGMCTLIWKVSWPLGANPPLSPPPNDVMIDLRHSGKANALFVDGSVRTMTFEDLKGQGGKYIEPPDME